MSKSTHQVAIKGVDQTAGAFNSIAARAKATGAQIRSIMGGAIAAAGAYLSFRSIKGGIEELGTLDDIAAKTKTNVSELTQAVTGFQILGVNTSIDDFARSLAFMRKNTGREGMEGFYQTVEEIGKIPDSAARAKKAVEVFGRSGMELMPLIDNANKGTEAIRGVVDAMPSIPASAAAAGDKANDAMTIVGKGFHSIWLKAIGAVCDLFDKHFVGGVREAAAKAMAWVEYFAENAGTIIKSTWYRWVSGTGKIAGTMLGTEIGAIKEWIMGRGTWEDVKDQIYDAWVSATKEYSDTIDEIEAPFEARAEEFAKKIRAAEQLAFNYKKATDNNAPLAEEIGTTAAKAAHRVTNQLMMGGSSAANRLAILGPEYQNEAKKQTDLLRKIAENTEKTAENTDEASEGYASTDLN
ncbi:MAG: hypothetical protein J6V72_05225 [Kiritimatiellae bacterium]|nr:hypothetical protein [Kiritimatiellia bacterium]